MDSPSLLLPLLVASAIMPAIAASQLHGADAITINATIPNIPPLERDSTGAGDEASESLLIKRDEWDELDESCGSWNASRKINNWHHPRRWWTSDWKEMIDYNWWPPNHAPFYEAPHYWVNQVTGHVRSYPCGDPMYRSSSKVYGRPVPTLSFHDFSRWPSPKEKDNWDLVRHPEIDRQFWQNRKNESNRWTDPLNPHRWWSKWTDRDGEPFWVDDFTNTTVTEEPLNANWSVTLRGSHDCEDDEAILGVIRHPIVNGCYPLDAGGEIDLGSGLDRSSFRYNGSFTVYPGPCKVRIFKFADCPSEDVAWLTHDPTAAWEKSGQWAVVNPEAGPTCFKLDEGRYAYNNMSGTMSVPEDDKSRYCTGNPGVDDPHLPPDPSWPKGLGEKLKKEMNVRWSTWLHNQYHKYKVREDSKFGLWLGREVPCRKNVESANIQKGLSKKFAPSIQVMCPAGDVGQWWRGDNEP